MPPTTLPNLNNLRMAMRLKTFLISITTGFWYFSSSINAVASQKLFQGFQSAPTDGIAIVTDNVILLSIVLTFLQLGTGAILSVGVLLSLSLGGCGQQEPPALQSDATSGSGNNSRSRKNPVSELFSQLQIQDIFIGLLHCIGSICTNIGFGYGSASLVQVIKLLEPVETLLLAALVQQSLNVLSPQKVASTLTIVAGTYLLLANASIEVNLQSVIFPIGSGICMASRNVLSKTGEKQENQTILLKGMNKFASITITAAVCSLVLAVFVILATLQFSTGAIIVGLIHQQSTKIVLQTIVFHCLYNMASITVLSLTSATSHSLLNVGKRIANVLIASMAFSIPITFRGKVGLVVSAIGACFYSRKAFHSKRSFLVAVIVLVVCVQLQQPIRNYQEWSTLSHNTSGKNLLCICLLPISSTIIYLISLLFSYASFFIALFLDIIATTCRCSRVIPSS